MMENSQKKKKENHLFVETYKYSPEKDTYVTTLIDLMCRALLGIDAYFILEANKFDVTNAFPHTYPNGDDKVSIRCPDGFKVPKFMLTFMKGLDGLSVTPRLRYNHLVKRLLCLSLKQVSESGCIFCGSILIVYFCVEDMVTFHIMRNKIIFDQFKQVLFETYMIRLLKSLSDSSE